MAIVESMIEGAIERIEASGAGVVITSMGVKIHFVPGPVLVVPPDPTVPPAPVRQKSIRSPSQRLTVQDLLKQDPLPGRTYPPHPTLGAPTILGFTYGTVIAEGFYDTGAGANVFHANHLEVDPAENVLLGPVTGSAAGVVKVNGVEIELLKDSRLSTNPDSPGSPLYLNDSGFEIDPTSIIPVPTAPNPPPPAPAPLPSSVEGYFSGTKFYAHLFEYGGPGLLAPLHDTTLPTNHPRISIERAEVRDLGTSFDIEVRGHVTTPPPLDAVRHTIEIRVRDMKPGTFGTKPADWDYRANERDSEIVGTLRMDFRTPAGTPVDRVPPIQRWRFRATVPKSGIHLLPLERIEARNRTAEGAIHAVNPAWHVRAELDTTVREG